MSTGEQWQHRHHGAAPTHSTSTTTTTLSRHVGVLLLLLYRRYVLAHLKHIKYLDYRLVDQQAVAVAKEQYQDELLDLEETENQQEEAAKAAEEKAERAALHKKAAMKGTTPRGAHSHSLSLTHSHARTQSHRHLRALHCNAPFLTHTHTLSLTACLRLYCTQQAWTNSSRT